MSELAPMTPANASLTSGGRTHGKDSVPDDLYPGSYQLVDGTGEPVPARLPDGRAMKSMLDEMIQDDLLAAKNRAAISGLVNGNKPFDGKKLKSDGQAYRSNWNDRQSESIIDTRCSADFNMLFDTARTIEVSFAPGFMKDPRIAEEYGNRIARAFTYVFTREPRIVESLQRAIRDRVELGLGFLIFPDKFDWRPKAIRRGRCFFNKTASANCEDIEVFYTLDTMMVSEAWDHIEKAAASETAGWYIDRLKKSLVDFFYKGGARHQFQDNYVLMMEDLERRIRTNDPGYYSKQYDVFPIVHGFIQERSGKASHYVMPYQSNCTDWVFESFEAADGMENLVIPLPYDYGDGTLDSVKGVGHRIFSLCTESNRMLMHTIDSGKLSTSLLVQNQGGADNLAFAFHRFGPITLMDKSLQPVQTAFTPRLEASFEMRELFQRILNNNTGISRTQMEDTTKRESMKTAEQVRVESSREVKTENDRAFLTYLRWDALVQQVFKRLISKNSRHAASPKKARAGAELFWDTCAALGVPEELFTKFSDKIIVRATRAIGAGSPHTKQQNLLALKNVASQSMSEHGRRQVDRELAMVLVGSDNVDKFIPLSDETQIPSNETSIANLEVNDFYEGTSVIVGVDQIHSVHIATHLAAMVQEAQMLQQDPMQVDVERASNLFQQGIPHTMRHMQLLASDPLREDEVAGYQQTLDQIIPIAQQVIQMAEQIKQAQQEEIARLREENMRLQQEFSKENLHHQRELMKIQLQAEAEQAKTQNLNENRNQKTQTQLQLQMEKLGAKLAMDNAAFQNEMMTKQTKLQAELAEAQVKIQLMMQESQAKMAAKGVAQ